MSGCGAWVEEVDGAGVGWRAAVHPPSLICRLLPALQELQDGTLAVSYCGTRRMQLLLVQQEEPYTVVAAEWYDDAQVPDLDPTVDVLEREATKLLQQARTARVGRPRVACRP